jgi:hypothetical protein
VAADAPDPALHYDFDNDDPATATIADVSGNDFHGVLVNTESAAVVDGADGGQAIALPGGASDSDGAYVEIPREVLEDATDLTVSARINWGGTTAPWQWIYALGTNTERYLFSTPYNGEGNLRTAITTSHAGGEAQVTGYAALPADTWKTLTVVLDTSAQRITTYLDGVAVASADTDIVAGELLDDSTDIAGYIGNSFYPDPLFGGAVDDFRIYRLALPAEQVADLVAAVPALTGLVETDFDVQTSIGTAPELPGAIRATFEDGYDRDVAVTWDDVDPADYQAPGVFTAHGSAAGTQVTASVTVVRENQLTIDLANTTGPVHGGAAGTLYGLYGEGVPTNNLIAGMNLRTVVTKAQDGAQHPGADALEVVKPLADSTDGDVYIYMTDIHRGFPYQWPGDTPQEKLDLYREKITKQVEQVLTLDPEYQDNIVFVPFNEPEGNMFGTGPWSYNGTSWLSDPTDYFAYWDEIYALIKAKVPDARIGGPSSSILYNQVRGFLQHTAEAGTVPDVMIWHELSHPDRIRDSVATYRDWEEELFTGTAYEGTELPININEYAFNYHTSVPGQIVQWISAIEESKVDADLAYWNIDGNLSDSAVQANRANGQWWLFNAYGSMTGETVEVTPPFPGQNYTLQAVASLDDSKPQARAVFGGADGNAWIQFHNVDPDLFGPQVHAWVREIPWTGQIGDSPQPEMVHEEVLDVTDGGVVFNFGDQLLELKESSAYEIVLTPAGAGNPQSVQPKLWQNSYEAEAADYTGSGYSVNGPEGSPSDVSKFYTSGAYNVGGLRTGSDGVLDFTVDVPEDGTYDLSVFANSLNTYPAIEDQGPTNVFVRVDGGAEQELFLPLAYKWVVWDHADTTVELTAGTHTISLAAQSLDGERATQGDAIIDRIVLSLPNPAAATSVYEAELADFDGAKLVLDDDRLRRAGVSGSGAVEIRRGDSVTFWVYSAVDAESTITVKALGRGRTTLSVNGVEVSRIGPKPEAVPVSLSGGINKVTVTGLAGRPLIDSIEVAPTTTMPVTEYQAEDAYVAGTAEAIPLSLADGGQAVGGVGGEPGNPSTLTFTVESDQAGTHAMRVRYSNPEQSAATHYNPDPLARHADVSVNGADPQRVLFPHSFHKNNFWELTVLVDLDKGENAIVFSSEELPNYDGETYISDEWPDVLLRSQYAPLIDKISITPFHGSAERER